LALGFRDVPFLRWWDRARGAALAVVPARKHDALMTESTLHLTRQLSKWRDRARDYTVVLDGSAIGEIANGATRDFRVSAGDHTLRMKIDWAGSREEHFHADAGETIEFTCRAADTKLAFAFFTAIKSFFRRDQWVVLERT
jgi:hypothetical protein